MPQLSDCDIYNQRYMSPRAYNFAGVDSLYNICFNYRFTTLIQTRQFRGQNIEFEDHTFWFDPNTLIFRQNMSDGYMSRQRHI